MNSLVKNPEFLSILRKANLRGQDRLRKKGDVMGVFRKTSLRGASPAYFAGLVGIRRGGKSCPFKTEDSIDFGFDRLLPQSEIVPFQNSGFDSVFPRVVKPARLQVG